MAARSFIVPILLTASTMLSSILVSKNLPCDQDISLTKLQVVLSLKIFTAKEILGCTIYDPPQECIFELAPGAYFAVPEEN